MIKRLFFLAISAAAFLLQGCSRAGLVPSVSIHDGFENSRLSSLWEADKIISADRELQPRVVRSGHGALQITLHTSDVFEAGRHGNPDSERAELTEADELISQEGKHYAFSFSMLIPADFPVVTRRLIIAQCKQECPRGADCDDDGPVLAVRYISGILSVTQTIGTQRITLWRSQEEFRNRWLDFRFRVCFSANSNGRIAGYLKDSLLFDYHGATAYQENRSTGYPTPGRFYFKMGLYRDTMAEPMTIFIDDYSKELLSDH